MTISISALTVIFIVVVILIFIALFIISLRIIENSQRIGKVELRMKVLEDTLNRLLENSDEILKNQAVSKVNLSNLVETVSKHNFKIEWLEKH